MYLLGRSRTGGQSPGLNGEDLGLQARTVQPAGACRTVAVSGTAPRFYDEAPDKVRGLQGVPSCLGHVHTYQTISSRRHSR
jgi:hypothetical protein